MKKVVFFGMIIMFIITSCTRKETETEVKIENTLKSVSFWSDSLGIEPSELLLTFERLNKAIDSIGYPDAGYKVWLVQSDTIKDFKFMIEGNWPNQTIYNTIHDHELYDVASRNDIMNKLKLVSYNRFTLLK